MVAVSADRVAARARARPPTPRPIALWLLAVAALVFAMVVIGGITRLTESGLSITSWKPISGIVPPLTHEAWTAEFDAYKRIPEYKAFNSAMTLDGFKRIFFWEYLHRLLGRLIGMAFALPLIWFWWRRAIPSGYLPRLVALLALGGFQGTIGWWMVMSGLEDGHTDVSHIRLAAHLLTALFTFAGLIWTALDLLGLERGKRSARLTGIAVVAFAALAIQLMLGAFTAGLDAGFAFNSWPLMGDAWFPTGGWHADWSTAANLVDNPIAVQFVHRWWAWVAAATVVALAWHARRAGAGWALPLVGGLVVVQIMLGIATLIGGVPIALAAAHQAAAAVLLAAVTVVAHRVGTRA